MNRARTIATTLLGLFLGGLVLFAAVSPAFAQTEGRDPERGFVQCDPTFPSGTEATEGAVGGSCDLCDLLQLINNAVFYAVSFVMVVATVFVFISGFLYLTAAGDEHRITQAKTSLKFAIVGMIIALLSFIVVKTVFVILKGGDVPLGTFSCEANTTAPPAPGTPGTPGTPGGPGGGTTTPPSTGTWGNPDDPNYYAENIIPVSGSCGPDFSVNKQAAANFEGFINALCAAGYTPKSIGGYNNRPIGNSNKKSNHAYGAAIDIDPNANPQCGSSGCPYTLPSNVGELAAQYGLYWGGYYCSSKDYMHFEVIGAPSTPNPSTACKG